jgi:hypothetical protein
MRRGILLLAAAVLSLGGCFERKLTVAFDQAEYDRLPQSGTAAMEGQAFLRTQGGDVKLAAGLEVACHPVTSYSTELFDEWIVKHGNVTGGDDRAPAYTRKTIADGEGRFRFDGLPPGDYYVWSWITWKWYNSGVLSDTGGFAYARVTVRNGETTKVVVTR